MLIFESLTVYQKAILFTHKVYTITKTWPKAEQFSLVDQIRRSATSIPLNIAEGSSRSRKDFMHFLDIARGSCFETVAVLTVAKNELYLSQNEYRSLYADIEEIIRILQGLKKSMKHSSAHRSVS